MSPLDAEEFLLTTDEGRALLAEAATVTKPGPAELARWRKAAPAEVVAAAARLAEARRRGRAKFARADAMWLDPVGVEQATAEPVARHKAERFRGRDRVVDLCSGIGGDLVALAAEAGHVDAVDADPGMVRRASWNAGVYEVGARVAVANGQAEQVADAVDSYYHIDPDRRVEGRRRAAQMIEDYHPGIDVLRGLANRTPGGAIKLGPASDFDAYFYGDEYEVELVSQGGEAKEATVWTGDLVTCRRRATRLPEGATWTDRDGPVGAYAGGRPLESWAFDPDPALLRSGLMDAFAEAHGLGRIAEAVDFLTGPERVESPFLAAFEVIEALPVDVKTLRRAVAAHGIGTLEIKVRGLELRPEALRSQLRPRGPASATLLLAGGGRSGPATAVLCRRPGARAG